MSTDWAAEGLLDGLEGAEREARVRLLDELEADGASLDALRAAVAEDRLQFLPAERALGGEAKFTVAEVAREIGMDPELARTYARTAGLPVFELDQRALTEVDRAALRDVITFRDAGLDDEDVLLITRVLGRGLSQAAEAMRSVVLKQTLRPGTDEHELATAYADAARWLEPLAGPMLGRLLRLHLAHAMRTELVSAAELAQGTLPGAREVAVAFADLVGFTRVGEQVAPEELGAIADRLESFTQRRVAPPVRLVKTIGDAVMLVSDDPGALVATMLGLVDDVEDAEADLPQLRVGIASGGALSRAGDWYGRPVNLASRLSDVARPGAVLVAEAVHDALEDDERFRFSFAGERRLKGIREATKGWRARLAENGAAARSSREK